MALSSRCAGLALVAVAPSRSEDLAFASTRVRTFPAAHSTRQSSAMWWPAAPCSHNACIRHRKLCPIKARSSHNLGMPLLKMVPNGQRFWLAVPEAGFSRQVACSETLNRVRSMRRLCRSTAMDDTVLTCKQKRQREHKWAHAQQVNAQAWSVPAVSEACCDGA